jgi:hypothetical protein
LNVLAQISGQKSRRAFLTSHVPGSASTVKVEPQKENPSEAPHFIWTTLTGAPPRAILDLIERQIGLRVKRFGIDFKHFRRNEATSA